MRFCSRTSPCRATARVFPNDATLLDYVASEPHAIGYASASYVQGAPSVNIVAVGRLLPTRANVEKDQYPLTYGLYAVTGADVDTNAYATAFRAFMQSARGRDAVRQRSALP